MGFFYCIPQIVMCIDYMNYHPVTVMKMMRLKIVFYIWLIELIQKTETTKSIDLHEVVSYCIPQIVIFIDYIDSVNSFVPSVQNT